METLVLVFHVMAALGIVGLVLLQHGKGADVGAAFGSGSSGSLFGASGSANFLSRATAALAVVFFLTSLGLTYFTSRKTEQEGVMATKPIPTQTLPSQIPTPDSPPVQSAPAIPQAPASAPAVPGAGALEPGSKAQDIPK
ncbi:MAG: preprotein translocase subunit SecG [Betaproteobacteria bacterium]|nr:preprotein translocase subunit SecG [Betaproteobacteria bacterium]MDH3436446.1 preprotein translocase subunit SecG [Betaproteobacteria bacterium]